MRMQKSSSPTMNILGIFPGECLRYAGEHGVDTGAILVKYGFSSNIEQFMGMSIDFQTMQQLMAETWTALPDESVGFKAGMRIPPTAYGNIGSGILSCANLRDAFCFVQHYWDLIGRGIVLDSRVEDNNFIITLNTELTVADFLNRWMVESAVAALWRMLMAVIPDKRHQFYVYFKFPRPSHLSDIQQYIPHVAYDFPFTQIIFPASLLDQSFPLYSEVGLKHATEQCEMQLKSLVPTNRLSVQVRKLLGISAYGFPDLHHMAQLISISPRTLRKKLNEEDQNYSLLLRQAKLHDAVHLLRNPAFSIAIIAEKLGYQDEANFCRAFKRWTGQTPTEMRRIIYPTKPLI